jgi:ATP-dependent helicase IRC3
MNLRNYQRECIDSILNFYAQGKNRLLVSLPTGSGKTVVFSQLTRELNQRTLILAHTSELLLQAKEQLLMMNVSLSVGLVDADHKEFGLPVVVSSIQAASVPANLKKLQEQNFQVLIFDECHHSPANNARKVLDVLGFGKKTSKLLVGFTATAFRSDKKGLGEIFDTVAYERGIKEMIADGFLVPPRGYKIATDLDLSAIKTIDGDYQQASLAQVMDTDAMNKLVIDSYIRIAANKKTLCFGASVQHAEHLSKEFKQRGISAEVIHGSMPKESRTAILERYKTGDLQVLSNCQLLTEGVDLPLTECVILAKPTRSKALYQQIVGRGLRLWPNKKEAIILEFNDKAHSLCNVTQLLSDGEIQTAVRTKQSHTQEIPSQLNPKLKAALVSHDPLGESFTWEKGENNTYVLRGTNNCTLEISQISLEKYQVIFSSEDERKCIASNLNFEWAFSSAEDWAKQNRRLFVFSDKDAEWRRLPISDKQKNIFKSRGFKAGIDQLTRGQASTLISSGSLKKR